MIETKVTIGFSASHLAGRRVPSDLGMLLKLQESGSNLHSLLGIKFLVGCQQPALVDEICSGRNNMQGAERFAYAQAMTDILHYVGFIAEDDKGCALGYWFGPSDFEIMTAPIVRLNLNGAFSILHGNGIIEALLIFAAKENERRFTELRDELDRLGLHVILKSLADATVPSFSPTPQSVFDKLVATYKTNLLAATSPDLGTAVQILAMERGPKII